ncbi:hypothetical protein [Burkholderia sp. Ac-20365]|jgi:hypothetical protein|uniref:hypothetical protein n=1 Tax=Burkholderia sp. Ac-20365 TaxID=2703897 RepID=UPI00197BABD4|nr:hypothetical protein [Burkholderia sp. Ac-20365]MBN3764674.1 hypothetical protein [Burkholderia sp. Ac-20365]
MFKSPRKRAFFLSRRIGATSSIVSSNVPVQFFDIDGRGKKRAATRFVHETEPLAELAEKEVGKHDALLSMKVVTGAVALVSSGALSMLQE